MRFLYLAIFISFISPYFQDLEYWLLFYFDKQRNKADQSDIDWDEVSQGSEQPIVKPSPPVVLNKQDVPNHPISEHGQAVNVFNPNRKINELVDFKSTFAWDINTK